MPFFSYVNTLAEEIGIPMLMSQSDFFAGCPLIVDAAYGIAFPIATPPTVYAVGPLLPPIAASAAHLQLPRLADAWLAKDASSTSVVYVNIGSITTMAKERVEAIVGALTHPSLRVIWMLPASHRDALPAGLPTSFRVKTLGGLDHYKVLAHSAVKLVVSHCGMAAAQEAVYFGKPIVCLPEFSDQLDVSMRVVEFGAGKVIVSKDLTTESLAAAVMSALSGGSACAKRARLLGERVRRAGGTPRR